MAEKGTEMIELKPQGKNSVSEKDREYMIELIRGADTDAGLCVWRSTPQADGFVLDGSSIMCGAMAETIVEQMLTTLVQTQGGRWGFVLRLVQELMEMRGEEGGVLGEPEGRA